MYIVQCPGIDQDVGEAGAQGIERERGLLQDTMESGITMKGRLVVDLQSTRSRI